MHGSGTSSEWQQAVRRRLRTKYFSQLKAALGELESQKPQSPIAWLMHGQKAIKTLKPIIGNCKLCASAQDIQYASLVDEAAMYLRMCAINYYNDSNQGDEAQNSLPLFAFAAEIAVNEPALSKCKKDYEDTMREVNSPVQPHVAPYSNNNQQYDFPKEESFWDTCLGRLLAYILVWGTIGLIVSIVSECVR